MLVCLWSSQRVWLVPAPCLFLEHPIYLLLQPLFVVGDVGGSGWLVTRGSDTER